MSVFPSLEESVEFAENPEPRCPCVLLLDTSGSMQGSPIVALNQGVRTFRDHLCRDPLASRRVEIAVVTFSSEVKVVQDFVTADQFDPPTLNADGLTCMATGITRALDLLQERKARYRTNGIAYYRPWVLMITDGEPQGEPDLTVVQATKRLKQEEDEKRVAFFAVGVDGANMAQLTQMMVRRPVKLVGLNFNEMFVWLSTSMQKVAQSKMDAQVPLPPPGTVSSAP
ncbi:MAG: hypothetical protein K0Q72_3207 [Armatimonadetes bacterium]|jgi:uncharacterized protein YegL|nr:hypothetical protein [Armatimonadota bacterium]